MKIRDYLADQKNYQVDRTYQRPEGVWSEEDKKYLIDTILKKDPMPLFVFNKVGKTNYIVDGQQRLHCIRQFVNNKIKLSGELFEDEEYHNKTFKELDKKIKDEILDYDIKVHKMLNADDEKVRAVFSKLQRGKPLHLGEKINAMPGKIVETIREVSKHKVFKSNFSKDNNRFQHYETIVRLLMLSKNGIKDLGVKAINKFMSENKGLNSSNDDVQRLKNNLDYLHACYGNDNSIEDGAMFTTIFLFIDRLKKDYVIENCNKKIYSFITEFYSNMWDETVRQSLSNYRQYFEHKSRFSERDIEVRVAILEEEFKKSKKYFTGIKDLDRQVSVAEKRSIFNQYNHKCAKCGKRVYKYNDLEYHHIKKYAKGGKTEISNIVPLCKQCHKNIHKKDKKIDISKIKFSKEDFRDDE